ncbi:hypothetical protein [Cellulomonas wangsupingiae]|uniref:Uncharacterized protein n=1 Tax=Cellulomonas wangsupingiae TaxID=2968085 RepID=A0ABY5K8T2_9CELL|nr:hypothetical protein [Cellulomonas wangsupingiae]MCC2333039.1 hypothetical protein [Cellulomonas wangsupingiae]UUI66755.1 hypothetical protein NP075_08680 [Cellulomonas wangsupingiae]
MSDLTVDGDVALSTVVMHHPARADRVCALLSAVAPLATRVVVDPDPTGPPSPLRTAKLAWAAVADGATHHLVLQDDIVPLRGFAAHVLNAVAGRPDAGVTLYAHWKSPHNAYLVRRAAVLGAPWARLCRVEWTPTLGLVLPADEARALAEYLSHLPDELLDDDDYVTPFCVERGLPVLATVPHLLDHGDAPSLSGYEDEGERRATVFDQAWTVPREHWSGQPTPAVVEARTCAVELRESRCVLRFLRAGTDEPLEHAFGWDWYEWAPLVDVDVDVVLDRWERAAGEVVLRGVPLTGSPDERVLRVSVEVWAACYLLGRDVATEARTRTLDPLGDAVRLGAVRAWIEAGLALADLTELGRDERVALDELGARGLAAGLGERERVRA